MNVNLGTEKYGMILGTHIFFSSVEMDVFFRMGFLLVVAVGSFSVWYTPTTDIFQKELIFVMRFGFVVLEGGEGQCFHIINISIFLSIYNVCIHNVYGYIYIYILYVYIYIMHTYIYIYIYVYILYVCVCVSLCVYVCK